jgi:ribosomal protein L10
MTVSEMSELRRLLRDSSIEYRVVKNTLARRASEGTPLEGIKDNFSGPVGVAIGYDEPVSLAKKVIEFAKSNEKLKIKGGVIEGKICELGELKTISELPSRETLLAMFIGAMQSPLRKVAMAMHATIAQFAYAMEALKNKRET